MCSQYYIKVDHYSPAKKNHSNGVSLGNVLLVSISKWATIGPQAKRHFKNGISLVVDSGRKLYTGLVYNTPYSTLLLKHELL